eukprot:6731549-Prymnesium_polylepis.1
MLAPAFLTTGLTEPTSGSYVPAPGVLVIDVGRCVVPDRKLFVLALRVGSGRTGSYRPGPGVSAPKMLMFSSRGAALPNGVDVLLNVWLEPAPTAVAALASYAPGSPVSSSIGRIF